MDKLCWVALLGEFCMRSNLKEIWMNPSWSSVLLFPWYIWPREWLSRIMSNILFYTRLQTACSISTDARQRRARKPKDILEKKVKDLNDFLSCTIHGNANYKEGIRPEATESNIQLSCKIFDLLRLWQKKSEAKHSPRSFSLITYRLITTRSIKNIQAAMHVLAGVVWKRCHDMSRIGRQA